MADQARIISFYRDLEILLFPLRAVQAEQA
jgi:hypothetical protein